MDWFITVPRKDRIEKIGVEGDRGIDRERIQAKPNKKAESKY
jgi:hypothetical protein